MVIYFLGVFCTEAEREVRIAGADDDIDQGLKWRMGRVGNCPPSFRQNRRRRWAAARRQRRATLLLAHPVLGSHLRRCYQIGNQEIHIRDKNSKYLSANMTAQDCSVKN